MDYKIYKSQGAKWQVTFDEKNRRVKCRHVEKGCFYLTSNTVFAQFIENAVKGMYPGMHYWTGDITELLQHLWGLRNVIDKFFTEEDKKEICNE